MTSLPTHTRAFVLESLGYEGLHLRERALPALGAGDVLIRMRAASLNFRDIKILKGVYARNPTLPVVTLSDGAGEVIATGPGVTAWRAGDRVLPIYMQGWFTGSIRGKDVASLSGEADGVARDYAVFTEENLLRIPDAWSFEEAASIPCAGVTAWNGLVVGGRVKTGETVLTQGSGGVSVFALQIARMSGARVIATSSDDAKLERLKALGASDGINYRTTPDWDRAARDLTGGRGVDQVMEVGGADTMERSIAALRDGGHLAKIGNLAGNIEPDPASMPRGIRYSRIGVGSREMTHDLMRAMAMHGVRPVIDSSYPFTALKEALQALETGKHFGKIVLQF